MLQERRASRITMSGFKVFDGCGKLFTSSLFVRGAGFNIPEAGSLLFANLRNCNRIAFEYHNMRKDRMSAPPIGSVRTVFNLNEQQEFDFELNLTEIERQFPGLKIRPSDRLSVQCFGKCASPKLKIEVVSNARLQRVFYWHRTLLRKQQRHYTMLHREKACVALLKINDEQHRPTWSCGPRCTFLKARSIQE